MDNEQIVAKLRQDHAYMVALMERIATLCTQTQARSDCNACPSEHHSLCQDTLEQLILRFADVTLRHNLVESACMSDRVPREHRQAHNEAHLAIAKEIQAIRQLFRKDGNGIAAIQQVGQVLAMLRKHLLEYDQPLESYLLATS